MRRGGRPQGRRLLTVFCIDNQYLKRYVLCRPMASHNSPPALTQATEVSHGPGWMHYYSSPRAVVSWTTAALHIYLSAIIADTSQNIPGGTLDGRYLDNLFRQGGLVAPHNDASVGASYEAPAT